MTAFSPADAARLQALFDRGWRAVMGGEEGVPRSEGVAILEQAEQAGHPGAGFVLAQIALGEVLLPLEWAAVNRRVHDSAQAGFPPALRTLALHWGRSPDPALHALGTLCLEHAAMGGDVISLALLGERLAIGHGCRPDGERADAIADLLHDSGLPLHPAARHWPPERAEPSSLAPLPRLPAVDLAAVFSPQVRETLSDRPAVWRVPGALSAEECRFVQFVAGPHLMPSITAAPDGSLVQVPLRTSHDAPMIPELEDVALRLIQRRMAAAAGLPLANAEELIVLRYRPGQEYRPHRDYLPPSLVVPLAEGGPGQRDATVIAYLNEVAEGGATRFPLKGLSVPPRTGELLAFRNLRDGGEPDTDTLHAGEPVLAGEKWICTLWIRQGRFRQI